MSAAAMVIVYVLAILRPVVELRTGFAHSTEEFGHPIRATCAAVDLALYIFAGVALVRRRWLGGTRLVAASLVIGLLYPASFVVDRSALFRRRDADDGSPRPIPCPLGGAGRADRDWRPSRFNRRGDPNTLDPCVLPPGSRGTSRSYTAPAASASRYSIGARIPSAEWGAWVLWSC